jgi:23S rRNA pseudouridine1911/1915/1917 synthase
VQPVESAIYGQVEAWSSLDATAAAFRGKPAAWTAGFDPRFRVLDETPDYIVVDKPAPLQVHPAKPGGPPTLLDGLRALLAYELINGGQLSIVNRLDRETSGVVLVAKNRVAARSFGRAMMRRGARKTYLAIVHDWPRDNSFTVDAPILRQGEVRDTAIYLKQMIHPAGAPCLTEFDVVARIEKKTAAGTQFALVCARPLTGRMHQIRVHLEHAGHPIVGDKIYGPDESCYVEFIKTGWTLSLANRLVLPRHALHSSRLAFDDESTGSLSWEAPLPDDLQEFKTADGDSFLLSAADDFATELELLRDPL